MLGTIKAKTTDKASEVQKKNEIIKDAIRNDAIGKEAIRNEAKRNVAKRNEAIGKEAHKKRRRKKPTPYERKRNDDSMNEGIEMNERI